LWNCWIWHNPLLWTASLNANNIDTQLLLSLLQPISSRRFLLNDLSFSRPIARHIPPFSFLCACAAAACKAATVAQYLPVGYVVAGEASAQQPVVEQVKPRSRIRKVLIAFILQAPCLPATSPPTALASCRG